MDYHKSSVKHPLFPGDGLTVEDILHVYFDISTGDDYPDADEWFTVEYLLPYSIKGLIILRRCQCLKESTFGDIAS